MVKEEISQMIILYHIVYDNKSFIHGLLIYHITSETLNHSINTLIQIIILSIIMLSIEIIVSIIFVLLIIIIIPFSLLEGDVSNDIFNDDLSYIYTIVSNSRDISLDNILPDNISQEDISQQEDIFHIQYVYYVIELKKKMKEDITMEDIFPKDNNPILNTYIAIYKLNLTDMDRIIRKIKIKEEDNIYTLYKNNIMAEVSDSSYYEKLVKILQGYAYLLFKLGKLEIKRDKDKIQFINILISSEYTSIIRNTQAYISIDNAYVDSILLAIPNDISDIKDIDYFDFIRRSLNNINEDGVIESRFFECNADSLFIYIGMNSFNVTIDNIKLYLYDILEESNKDNYIINWEILLEKKTYNDNKIEHRLCKKIIENVDDVPRFLNKIQEIKIQYLTQDKYITAYKERYTDELLKTTCEHT